MRSLWIFILTCLLFASGCTHLVRIDGPYKGKVVDYKTGEPIEGAVVVGYWNLSSPFPLVAYEFYDATETVTDKDGNFVIPGKGLRVFSRLDPIYIFIFKSGYSCLSVGSWAGLYEWEYVNHHGIHDVAGTKLVWDGPRMVTVHLTKLTMEERLDRGMGTPTINPDYMKKYQEEMEKERIETRPFRRTNEGGRQ